MRGRSHLVVGACAYVAGTSLVGWSTGVATPTIDLALGLGACLLGSVLPDVDSERSLLGRHLHLPVEHRTITHAVWIPASLIVCGLLWMPPVLWCGIGWLSHILVDGLSRAGVCYLWPLTDYVRYDGGAFVARGHKPWLKWYGADQPSREAALVVGIVLVTALIVWLCWTLPTPPAPRTLQIMPVVI